MAEPTLIAPPYKTKSPGASIIVLQPAFPPNCVGDVSPSVHSTKYRADSSAPDSDQTPSAIRFIVVVGATGAGKTALIRSITGFGEPGKTPDPNTQHIQVRNGMMEGKSLKVIDIPGFDTISDSGDSTGLKALFGWFKEHKEPANQKITAILYLHRIADNRVPNQAKTFIKELFDFVGKDNLPNVMLATSMWDIVGTPRVDISAMRPSSYNSGPIFEKGRGSKG